MEKPTIIEVQSQDEFVKHAHEMIKEKIVSALNEHGSCIVGLSGGSTPGPVYASLASDKEINWKQVTLFLVDDRFVPTDDKDSNQKLLKDTLLDHIDDDRKPRVIVPDTMLAIDECVTKYESDLRVIMKNRSADLVILGMGEDGHTASLFPGDEKALNEKERWVLHTTTDQFAVKDRITVTLPVLNAADCRLFLLSGEKKRALVLAHDVSLPAFRVSDAEWIIL